MFVIAEVVSKKTAKKRMKEGLPCYGMVWGWSDVSCVSMLDKELGVAFMKRFPKAEEDVAYASSIKTVHEGDGIDLPVGKFLVVNGELTEFKTVKELYDAFCETEEEYISKTYGYAQELDEENDEEEKE